MKIKSDHLHMSAQQREFAARLSLINCKRCLCSSVIFALLLPIVGIAEYFAGTGTVGIWAFVIVAETVQVSMLFVLLYIVRRNEQDFMPAMYRVYYGLTIALCLFLSAQEYRQSKSLLFLVAAMGYYVFVPVFARKEQRISSWIMLVLAAVYGITVSSLGVRAVVDAAIVLAAAIVLGRYSQEKTRYQVRVRDELRERTISSEHDALTGLMNRRGLARRVSLLWSYCSRMHAMVGVIAIDVDFFKKYNDKFGHPEGDKCLKKVAAAIKDSAQRGSDITARTGGEEFLVFVQDMSEEEMVELALKIRGGIAELQIPHAYAGVSKHVTVSMGIAYTYPNSENNFKKLYEEADQALYTAKENGRNCIVCRNLVYGRMKNGLGTLISS